MPDNSDDSLTPSPKDPGKTSSGSTAIQVRVVLLRGESWIRMGGYVKCFYHVLLNFSKTTLFNLAEKCVKMCKNIEKIIKI